MLTVEVEQVLVVTALGHVSWGHWVRGENRPPQVRSPQVIRAQRLFLSFTMWRKGWGLFCNIDTQGQSGPRNNIQLDMH